MEQSLGQFDCGGGEGHGGDRGGERHGGDGGGEGHRGDHGRETPRARSKTSKREDVRDSRGGCTELLGMACSMLVPPHLLAAACSSKGVAARRSVVLPLELSAPWTTLAPVVDVHEYHTSIYMYKYMYKWSEWSVSSHTTASSGEISENLVVLAIMTFIKARQVLEMICPPAFDTGGGTLIRFALVGQLRPRHLVCR